MPKVTRCRHGHILTKSNIYYNKGVKECRACKKMYLKRWRERTMKMLQKNKDRKPFHVGDSVKVKTPEMVDMAEGSIVVVLPGWIHKVFIPRGVKTRCAGRDRLVHNVYAESDQLTHTEAR